MIRSEIEPAIVMGNRLVSLVSSLNKITLMLDILPTYTRALTIGNRLTEVVHMIMELEKVLMDFMSHEGIY